MMSNQRPEPIPIAKAPEFCAVCKESTAQSSGALAMWREFRPRDTNINPTYDVRCPQSAATSTE